MKELMGFNRPNDFAIFSLRAKLSRLYGLFGQVPAWGGTKLHEFYPPLSTIVVRIFGITAAVLLYLAVVSVTWSIYRGPLIAVLFLFSFCHFYTMMLAGRFSEYLGYYFVALAVFLKMNVLSGLFLGLAGLCYPVPLMLGGILLLSRLDVVPYLIAFVVCGWWYVPFFLKRRRLTFLKEKRADKVFGLYRVQWAGMVNVTVFMFCPEWLAVIFFAGQWILELIILYRSYGLAEAAGRLKLLLSVKPFWADDLVKRFPLINRIDEKVVILKDKPAGSNFLRMDDEIAGSLKIWVWACACYLIDKGIVVYNGLPSTEVPHEKTIPDTIPQDIKSYWLDELR
jgi:hypothetical protein